jgi:hypothetical protein
MGWDRDDAANRPDLPHERRDRELEREDRLAEYAPAAPQCWLARFSDRPCDGALVRVHLLPKRELKKLWREVHHGRRRGDERTLPFSSFEEMWKDPRTWVPGCGGPMGNAGHHGMLDTSRTLRIPFDALPAATVELAEELRLSWWLEREYRRESEAA